MKVSFFLWTPFAITLVFCLYPKSLSAQAGSASIDGFVQDVSGSVIPGARVTLSRQGNGDIRRTVSNGEGVFSFVGLMAGTYTLGVEFDGFGKLTRTGISLHSGDAASLRALTLAPGTLNQELAVIGSAEAVMPEDSGEKASVIESKQIQNMSIIGRSAYDLLKMISGVTSQWQASGEVVGFANGQVASFSVVGTRGEGLNIIADGADVIAATCNCGLAVTPNMDMIQEVKVQTASFGAENARGPTVFKTVSKEGTSQFHGAAYLYARNHKLNSKDWQANFYDVAKPRDSFYFPGFNIGGPLLIPGTQFNKNRDKLFFFLGAEWMRQNVDLGVIPTMVPTAKMRQGDFSEITNGYQLAAPDVQTLPSLNGKNPTTVIDPALFDPGGQILMNLLPLPNRVPAANSGLNFVSDIINPQPRAQILARVDYNISDDTKLFTRLNYEGETVPYPYSVWNVAFVPYPTRGIGSHGSVSSSSSLTQAVNPVTTNEVVFAATRFKYSQRFEDPSKASRKALGYPYHGIFKNDVDVIPNFGDLGGGVPMLFQSGAMAPEFHDNNWLISLSDNFTKVTGTHTWKFGGFFQISTSDGIPSPQQPEQGQIIFSNGFRNSTGNAYADMLLGRPGIYQETSRIPAGQMR
jgi:carboxypeptidase family protein